MKKIIFFFVLFTGSFLNRSYGRNHVVPFSAEEHSLYSTIIVDADVTIVLINDPKASLQVMGSSLLSESVSVQQSHDTLYISAKPGKDLRDAGIIYLPVNAVQEIQINSKALVRSLDILHVSNLDIIVNGACSFMLLHTGGIHIKGSGEYEVEQTVQRLYSRRHGSKGKQPEFQLAF